MSRPSIVRQVTERLNRMFTPGASKYQAKKAGTMKDNIFSYGTLKDYKNICLRAIRDIERAEGITITELNQASKYLDGYMERLEAKGRSAWTLDTYRSGLRKLFNGVSADPIDYQTPSRKRSNIKRSREEPNKRFSEKRHADLVAFIRSTGLRGRREAERIRGTALVLEDDGEYSLIVKGKGGLVRRSPIVGPPEEVALVVDMMQKAGKEKVLGPLPSGCTPHRYRADYAARVYHKHARPIEELPRQQRYVCRGDMKGKVFDKQALMAASKALGHSRTVVVAHSYSYKF